MSKYQHLMFENVALSGSWDYLYVTTLLRWWDELPICHFRKIGKYYLVPILKKRQREKYWLYEIVFIQTWSREWWKISSLLLWCSFGEMFSITTNIIQPGDCCVGYQDSLSRFRYPNVMINNIFWNVNFNIWLVLLNYIAYKVLKKGCVTIIYASSFQPQCSTMILIWCWRVSMVEPSIQCSLTEKPAFWRADDGKETDY